MFVTDGNVHRGNGWWVLVIDGSVNSGHGQWEDVGVAAVQIEAMDDWGGGLGGG